MSNPLTLAPPKTKLLQQFSSNQPPPQYFHMLPKSQSMYETPVKYQQTNFTHPLFSKCSRDVNNKHQTRTTAKFLFFLNVHSIRFCHQYTIASRTRKIVVRYGFPSNKGYQKKQFSKMFTVNFPGFLETQTDSICQHL